MLIAIVLLTSPAAATQASPSGASYVWSAPFSGFGSAAVSASNNPCPGENYTLVSPPFFNLTNGHFGVAQTASVTASHCKFQTKSTALFILKYRYFFHSNLSGARVFRTLWSLAWSSNLSSDVTNLSGGRSYHTHASFGWFVNESVQDRTLDSPLVRAEFSGGVTVSGTSTEVVARDSSLNFPFQTTYVLTKGHFYEVSLELTLKITTAADGNGNSASASLVVGLSAQPSELREIQFK